MIQGRTWPDPEVTAAVLAGGRSRRMGRDKALLRPWGPEGPTLLERILAILAPFCAHRLVVRGGDLDPLPPLPEGVQQVPDRRPGLGPLAGLEAALAAARTPWVLLAAVDLIGLRPPFVAYLLSQPREDVDVVVPQRPGGARNERGVEPLLALYRRRLLPLVERALDRGIRRPVDLFPEARVRVLAAAELRRVDPGLESLVNVNTPGELEAWRRRVAEGRQADGGG